MSTKKTTKATKKTKINLGKFLKTTTIANKTPFQLNAPQAKSVTLIGDFNKWDTKGLKMRKDRTGTWKAEVSLKPGAYEYKFMVDGQWWTDPNNNNTRQNDFGAVNSVKEV